MTGTVISKLKRKDNGKEFLIFKMDNNFIIGGYAFVTENEIINLKKLYDESKFFTCRETTQNNVEIHQKTEDEPFSLQ